MAIEIAVGVEPLSVVINFSGGRSIEAADHVEQGRFSASALADDGDIVSPADGKSRIGERIDFPFVIMATNLSPFDQDWGRRA